MRSTASVASECEVHDVDIVLNLVDAKPIRIDAVGACIVGPQEDVANARIVFDDGCIANLSASRVSYEVMYT